MRALSLAAILAGFAVAWMTPLISAGLCNDGTSLACPEETGPVWELQTVYVLGPGALVMALAFWWSARRAPRGRVTRVLACLFLATTVAWVAFAQSL